jgi:hypothetical protein
VPHEVLARIAGRRERGQFSVEGFLQLSLRRSRRHSARHRPLPTLAACANRNSVLLAFIVNSASMLKLALNSVKCVAQIAL